MPRKLPDQLKNRFQAALAESAEAFGAAEPSPDLARLEARRQLRRAEKILAGLIYERVENVLAFSRIHIKGDQALFGGASTRTMKKRLGLPKGRALADFLPAIVLHAKRIANEITIERVKRDYLHTEAQITREFVKNNRALRRLLGLRRVKPEDAPAAEDIKRIERRLAGTRAARPMPPQSSPPRQLPAQPEPRHQAPSREELLPFARLDSPSFPAPPLSSPQESAR
jgi:DNA-damage-inducible protein D